MNKDSSRPCILVTGGGTGGHLMPAIAFCEMLNAKGYQVILATDTRCISYLPKNPQFNIEIFHLTRPSNIANFFRFCSSFVYALAQSFKILSRNNIKLVIGCGGYSCSPVIIASILRFTPFILQEQNSIIGTANYFFGYFANKLFISFMHTTNLPPIGHKKIIWVPMPLLKKHSNHKYHRNSELESTITILVTGGSQGANIFDDVITDAVILLAKRYKDRKFKVFQQSINKCYEITEKYNSYKIKSITEPFFHDIEKYYTEADFFIGRSGASTVNEIIHYTIPAIFIPYPFAANDHQYYNAKNLSEFGAAWVVLQKDITSEKIVDIFGTLIESSELRQKAIDNLSKMRQDRTEIALTHIKKLIDKNL